MSLNLPASSPDLFSLSKSVPPKPTASVAVTKIPETPATTAPLPLNDVATPSLIPDVPPKTVPKAPAPIAPQAPVPSVPKPTASVTLGGVLSAVLQDDPAIRKQMTAAEQEAVKAVIKNVGTPDEYGTAVEYVLRALPYVRSVYSVMDVVQPIMPSNVEIGILMKERYFF